MKIINGLKIAFMMCLFLTTAGCEDYFDKTPLDRISPSQSFQSAEDLETHTNSFYGMLPRGTGITYSDNTSDLIAKGDIDKFLRGAYTVEDASGWSWGDLHDLNYFLENYNNKNIPIDARANYAGIARFFRAWFYFEKVKRFGDVPWYSKTLDVDDPDLYKARDPRTLVMDSVLADLNFAVDNIYSQKDNTSSRITKWVALAFKSRVCLFEGTYRKYHTELDFAQSSDAWLKEAASSALQLMQSGQYSLYNTGTPEEDYRQLFTRESPLSQELILSRVYNSELRVWHDANWKYNSGTFGDRSGLVKTFVNTYLKLDGSRVTDGQGYNEIPFIDEVKNRDHRLKQTIRAGITIRSDGNSWAPNFDQTYTGYHIRKFTLPDISLDSKAENNNSLPLIRYAEVLLNYAEAKAELGDFGTNEWDMTIKLLRERAGVDGSEPLTADPYLISNFYPEISDKYILEIRRERATELISEGFRYDDLMRWKKGDLLLKPYYGIYVPSMDSEIDLDGNGAPDVSFVMTIPAQKTPGVFYFRIDNNQMILTEGDHGLLNWLSKVDRIFPDKNYLYPIPPSQILLNPNLEQTAGWGNN